MSAPAEHFDATKFNANGNPRKAGSGRRSKIKPDEVAQLFALAKIIRVAQLDLADYLHERGYVGTEAQRRIMQELRKGWRPRP